MLSPRGDDRRDLSADGRVGIAPSFSNGLQRKDEDEFDALIDWRYGVNVQPVSELMAIAVRDWIGLPCLVPFNGRSFQSGLTMTQTSLDFPRS